MLVVIALVIAGLVVGRWFGRFPAGWKTYASAVIAGLIIVPATGVLTAILQARITGGNQDDLTGIALGLGVAVALIEVPLLVFKRQRSAARLDSQQTGTITQSHIIGAGSEQKK